MSDRTRVLTVWIGLIIVMAVGAWAVAFPGEEPFAGALMTVPPLSMTVVLLHDTCRGRFQRAPTPESNDG